LQLASRCTNTTMSSFSVYLTSRMGRVVVDQTGLQGSYDFALQLDGKPCPPAIPPRRNDRWEPP
jgi:uncharacterized protein (TIGR03435 family)